MKINSLGVSLPHIGGALSVGNGIRSVLNDLITSKHNDTNTIITTEDNS